MWSVVNDGCLHSLLGDSLKDKVTQTTKPNRIYGCRWSCNLFRMSPHSQISCRALRFLEAAPHLLQEGAPDQSCSCSKEICAVYIKTGVELMQGRGAALQGVTRAGRTCPISHFTGSLLLRAQHCPLSLSCCTWPSAEQEQKY